MGFDGNVEATVLSSPFIETFDTFLWLLQPYNDVDTIKKSVIRCFIYYSAGLQIKVISTNTRHIIKQGGIIDFILQFFNNALFLKMLSLYPPMPLKVRRE
jgi:hypothetical protein